MAFFRLAEDGNAKAASRPRVQPAPAASNTALRFGQGPSKDRAARASTSGVDETAFTNF